MPAPQAAQSQALLEELEILSLLPLCTVVRSCQEWGQPDHVCLAGSADGPRCSFHPASPTHATATAVPRASASTEHAPRVHDVQHPDAFAAAAAAQQRGALSWLHPAGIHSPLQPRADGAAAAGAAGQRGSAAGSCLHAAPGGCSAVDPSASAAKLVDRGRPGQCINRTYTSNLELSTAAPGANATEAAGDPTAETLPDAAGAAAADS